MRTLVYSARVISACMATGLMGVVCSAEAGSDDRTRPVRRGSPRTEQFRPLAILYPGSERVLNPSNGHYYQRVDLPLSWKEARRVCEGVGGHLATVTSAEENRFIFQEFATTHVCWLGATDEAEEGKWQWITGERFSFQPWYEGEPNNSDGTEHYLVMGNRSSIYVNRKRFYYRVAELWNDHADGGLFGDGKIAIVYPVCEWDSAPPMEASRLRAKPSGNIDALYRFLEDLKPLRPDVSPGSTQFSWPAPQCMLEAAVEILQQTRDPFSAEAQPALQVFLEDRIGTLDRSPFAQQERTIAIIRTFLLSKLKESRLVLEDAHLAWWAARALENAGEPELAKDAYGIFAEAVAREDTEALQEVANAMQTAAQRLNSEPTPTGD